jgi:hypothetical protein
MFSQPPKLDSIEVTMSSEDRTVETENVRAYVYSKDVITHVYNIETKSAELC